MDSKIESMLGIGRARSRTPFALSPARQEFCSRPLRTVTAERGKNIPMSLSFARFSGVR